MDVQSPRFQLSTDRARDGSKPRPGLRRQVLRALLVVGLLGVAQAGAENPRVLFVAIDAVPFEIAEEAARDPENTVLSSLSGPVPLISTFPSATSLALAAILGAAGVEQSPGYEARHYDWESNRVSGGGVINYKPFPWRAFFDWKVEGLWRKAISAVRPLKASAKDIEQSLEAFRASDKSPFFIYYDTTDSGGHLRGPRSLLPILADLDGHLARLRDELGPDGLRLVVFSDHGISGDVPLYNVRKNVMASLRDAGFRRRKKLEAPGDVVFVPFGLLSSFVAFTSPEESFAVAEAIVKTEGVAVCAGRFGDDVEVFGREGSAKVERRTTDGRIEWRYQVAGTDPLDVDVEFREAGLGAGWMSDDDVFDVTRRSFYPDPFHRLFTGFERVDNPATVLCSLEEDAMYGSRMTNFGSRLTGGRLKWTHGALHRDASLGFFMADTGDAPETAIRFDEALRPYFDLDGTIRAGADGGALSRPDAGTTP